MTNLELYLKQTRDQIEAFLDGCMPRTSPFAEVIFEAMRYSVLGGGKRLRAILAIATAKVLNGKDENVLPIASALEMIHAYSLVHDDLPAMDNDDYRRGKLTTHKKFGEAMGILTGDALQTHAFWVVANKTQDKEIVPLLVENLSWLAGIGGMVIGQVADIMGETQEPSSQLLEFIHFHKTGALIMAATKCGAIAAKGSPDEVHRMTVYGSKLGLSFQIIDDIMDVTSTQENMGKAVGKDQNKNKQTYPRIWGLEKSAAMAKQLIQEAKDIVSEIPNNHLLRELADYVTMRKN